jgi:DNA-directed RNA polymerase specialized sigma24 family protein
MAEDACGFAWMQFVRHQPDRDGAWRAWLITTATREAIRLKRDRGSAVRFIPEVEYRVRGGAREIEWPWHDESRRAEALEALELLSKLPDRRPRVLEL